MTALWVVTVAALAVAVAAVLSARRAHARLAQLSEMHWELKYQYLELRKQIERTPGGAASSPTVSSPTPPPAARESFVPLTSLRR
jgi:hypothetical protein